MQRKAESGSQLLARLIARVNLSSVDPLVFGNSHFSSTETPSNQGKVVELYGPEGVGKSELALLYIAKICLPCQWKGHSLGGLSAKVAFVDTEFKFSVLHLAIIMEQMVQQYVNRKQQATKNVGLDVETNKQTMSSTNINSNSLEPCPKDSSNFFQRHGNTDRKTSSNLPVLPSLNEQLCLQNGKLSPSYGVSEEGASADQEELSPLMAEDIEEIVCDSLGRLQVLRVSNTQELTATVISLSAAVSSDPLLSLVVVDTISAYYWIDKMLSSDSSQSTEASIAPIANSIAKQVSESGITYLVIKSALIGQKKKWCADADPSCDKSDSSTATKTLDHVEFLGRTWGRLNVRRIVMSQKTVNGKKQLLACCSEWQQERVFTFIDDLLCL